jgi:hypothetical protein
MENVYHILYNKPALEKWQIPDELEEIAQSIVQSGRFRIDAEEKVNFVRFSHPALNVNIVFSYRELCDENLIPRTRGIMTNALSVKYRGKRLADKVESEIERLRHDVTKIIEVDPKTEIKLARAIVQATHPVVMLLLLIENTELFISYSHTVGDMLDIQSWQQVGTSSGLQSTGYEESAVFVSCGGNPFVPEKNKEYFGDGFNALARMLVIGGQELGHYSDIIRDRYGNKISRHSANIYGSRAKEHVRLARQADIKHADLIKTNLDVLHLHDLAQYENHIKFFKKHKRHGLIKLNTMRKANNLTRKLFKKFKKFNMGFLTKIHRDNDGHVGVHIEMMVSDMRYNLAPQADAYKDPNPNVEEATACIEALARVPQQVNKWGHLITKSMMPHLYDIYYNEVIPACINSYEEFTGKSYDIKIIEKNIFRKFWERVFYRVV